MTSGPLSSDLRPDAQAQPEAQALMSGPVSTAHPAATPRGGQAFHPAPPDPLPSPFSSFVLGGFECSTHRRPSGRRVDVIDATAHDRLARQDYGRLRASGFGGARDGLRWHLIEREPGCYDFSSAQAQVDAARQNGVSVIWDLLHYGVPDFVDVFSPRFPQVFAAFAGAAAAWLRPQTVGELWLCPVNEISFFAWAGGEVGYLSPGAHGRGGSLKANLVRAAIGAMDAVRGVDPCARFLHAEPLIHVVPHPERPGELQHAQGVHDSQHEALDMLLGRLQPELGGAEGYVDVVGVNYYPYNQWRHHPDHGQREVLPAGHPEARPLKTLLTGLYARFGRPMLIAETGTEDAARAPWFEEVASQALRARQAGVPVLGVCLYPVVNHPGWDDDRHCHNGLWDYPDPLGHRAAYPPLADAVARVLRAARGGELEGEVAPQERVPAAPDLATALAHLEAVGAAIHREADAGDADGAFPVAALAALRDAGLLTVTLNAAEGGLDPGGLEELDLLRAVGRASLGVGQVYGGHLQALRLIGRSGTPAQRASAARDARSGEIFGVWPAGASPGLTLSPGTAGGWMLSGRATFAPGAAFVTRLLVTAGLPGGQEHCMALLRGPLDSARLDASGSADLRGLAVASGDLIGGAGAPYAPTDASGGVLYALAVQLGGADLLLDAAMTALRGAGRAGDDLQRLRVAELAARLEAAWQTVRHGSRLLQAPAPPSPSALAYLKLARLVTGDACLLACEGVERAVGARDPLQPGLYRALRELRLSLSRTAADDTRLALGAHLLGSPTWPEPGWNPPGVDDDCG